MVMQKSWQIAQSMASLQRSLGWKYWLCEGKFDLGSLCIQRLIIDGLNVLFLFLFIVLLIIGSVRKSNSNGDTRKHWIFTTVSVYCAVISCTYIISGVWDVLDGSDESRNLIGVVDLLRGLVWISLSVSLIVRRIRWVRVLVIVWWVSFSLLSSALNVEVLVKMQGIHIIDIVSWPAKLMLLLCAWKHFSQIASQNRHDQSLSEPLIGKCDTHRTELCRASFISRLTFSWLHPLLRLGYSKPLNLGDVPDLTSEDEALIAYQKFYDAWGCLRRDKSSTNTHNLVIWALAKVFMKEMIIVAIYAFLRTVAVVVLPLSLYAFVQYSESKNENMIDGVFLVGCLAIIKVTESLSQRHWFFNSRRSGMQMRSALMVAVYQKQLKLSSPGRRRHTTGEIVNYIAVDAYRMGEFPWWFHMGWSLTVQLFFGIGVLFFTVGVGVLPGLVPLLVCAFLNVPFAKFLQNCQSRFMVAQDERLRATSEVLNNMKIIKLQSWEEKFKNLIESFRLKEFEWLTELQVKKSYCTALYWMSPTMVSSVIIIGCALWRTAPLNASTIFTVLAALRMVAEPVRTIPDALSMLIQVKVSFDRLHVFLLEDEISDENVQRIQPQDSENVVRICAGAFSWDQYTTATTLRGLNFEVRRGEKVAFCGPVGAGKSSLLYAILGEIPKVSGTVDVYGSVAYVSQTSWIQSGTIRDNILFGKPMDKTRYSKAIKACALDKDIENFDHGDLTEIGQRGLNMSGGQKQRIQLARAVYNDADIYLLDDPFSAVDAHTAAILFNDCVMGALAKKTVILVTHQVEFLTATDRILVMEGGEIIQIGSYKELLTVGTAFEQLVNAHKDAITVLDPENNGHVSELEVNRLDGSMGSYPTKQNSEAEISVKAQLGNQLTVDEETEIGDAGWKPYLDYLYVSKGSLLFGLSTFSQSTFVALQLAATYWLAVAIQIPQISSGILIGIYAGLSALSAVFAFLRSWFAAHLGLKASKTFFAGFTNSVFKAPMVFFDSTPVGRILTRASSDLSVLDFDIPFSMAYVMAGSIEVLTTIGVAASVTWQIIFIAILAMTATIYVQRYYLASARELIRMNGTTKAPVMNYAAETSLGVVTIRAFDMMDRFFQNYLKLIDTDAKLFFHSNAAMEWLVIRIEVLQNVTLFFIALLLVLLPQGVVAPGFVGLSLSYALTLTNTQVFTSRWYCSLANYIVSVERIKQFMHIPSEPPAIVEDKRPPSSWPSQGRIELLDLKIKYRPNAPLVLKGISCTFKEGTRVGVVGRTGSGKTTLISALFRLVEPVSGRILIDGLDICSIGLKDLRMKLSVIPQEPALFKGSIRTNLDPLGLYSDNEIWEAIEKCQLKSTVLSLPNLLDSSVSDEGENWSAGQRQLFCLGRVLLKRNRILVLDEATASIDSATDAVLQRIIRQEFSSCTVVTVAHRVPTVIDSDMVMVLSYGKLVEFDEPSKLMEVNSYFSKLVAEYWSSCRGKSKQSLSNYQ
ncbi:LOW QUALITY PROTEIN: ABC transporter C family member 8-like [Macadamia integrifolia]|uniref:LOW QUALITY PROTEIN: ABC transporter C family member 8-like n=1 Tax=Macadamia integrifolia TaxID=60698 RepID=UPI001C4FDE92|nr:LOW QUALITY PROTEIN: ABC transporter C family member 8-like [Macadamia integrifolia]